MINFNKILSEVLRIIGDNPETEIVRYQYYNIIIKCCLYAIEHGYADYIDGINCFMSKDYIYIITGTGKEEVYNRKYIKTNIIDTDEGKSFAEFIKNRYEIIFPEFLRIH